MNLLEARAELVSLLDGYNVKSFIPSGITPPVVVIRVGSPYLEPGRTFGDWTVNYSIVVVGGSATNEDATFFVDTSVQDILPKLEGNWAIDSVEPEILTDGGYDYPAVVINTHYQVNF